MALISVKSGGPIRAVLNQQVEPPGNSHRVGPPDLIELMAKISEVFEGARFGRLTAVRVERHQTKGRTRLLVSCKCDCGGTTTTRLDQLGVATLSCGCLNAENTKAKGLANKTHGMALTGTYKSWAEMWARCTNPNHPKFNRYAERKPPESWRDFTVFLSDMGERPAGHSIERVDNNLPYGPDNCKWIPLADQGKNTSRVIRVTNGDVVLSLRDAATLAGLNEKTVRSRLAQSGWPLDKALGPGWSFVDPAQASKYLLRPEESSL